MAQLRQDYQEFVARNAEVIAVGPEDVKAFSDFWISHKMPFPGIPDPTHTMANLFGQKVNLFKMGRMPALIVIDKEGRIRYSHYGDSMSDIPTDKEILSLLDDLNKELS
jgi:peroxiredoxin Q/BCP